MAETSNKIVARIELAGRYRPARIPEIKNIVRRTKGYFDQKNMTIKLVKWPEIQIINNGLFILGLVVGCYYFSHQLVANNIFIL